MSYFRFDIPHRYWNRYPGARVDSPVPHYEFSDPGLYSDWAWSQRFPGSAEIRKYFRHVADKWDLDKDTVFQTTVNSAIWDDAESRWMIHTNNNVAYRCQFFLPNTGIAAKRHTPSWEGIEKFEGSWIHPSYWPKEEADLRGKRIAVIGTGSSGVQITQEIAPLASEFVLFQRTPNLALPMKQVAFSGKGTEIVPRSEYESFFNGRKDSFCGFDYSFASKSTFEDSTEDRHKVYEDLWSHGDFHFWLATYSDMLFDDNANTEAYNFWYVRWLSRAPTSLSTYLKVKLTRSTAGVTKSALACPTKGFVRNLHLPLSHMLLVASGFHSRTSSTSSSPNPTCTSWT